MNEQEIMTEVIKRSSLHASSRYDLHKLQSAGEHFLPITIQEREEELEFTYDSKRMRSFTEIRQESVEVILNILIQMARFATDREKYDFSMEPANLYYNSNGRVCIKTRDLSSQQEDSFLASYKALTACALTGKYSYQDYLEGGEEFFGSIPTTRFLLAVTTVMELEESLEKYKEEHLHIQKSKHITVSKTSNLIWKTAAGVFAVATIVLGIYGYRQFFQQMPHLTAVSKGNNAYIEGDSVALIDALKPVGLEAMDKHQKYILAEAYLQSENLSNEQKENRLEKLSLSSNEKELEYWIMLGRMEAAAGEDLAMQLSDDELLLYAYLKDKAQVQSDTKLAGSEKEERLADLQGKIDSLKEEYKIGEEEDDNTDRKGK